MKNIIRIATRKSPLALWQTEHIKNLLLKINPELEIHFVGLSTQGDREQNKALTNIGGKSLFVKELQKALLENDADIAVHSIKDMSVNDSPGLTLAAICEREDPRDAFVSNDYKTIEALPNNAIVGTASPRRSALLKALRPDINIKLLRGNVGTRLEKCACGEYDGTILAAAGLKRLALEKHITQFLSIDTFIPAIGQGAIGIECREGDNTLKALLQNINHITTAQSVTAERAVNRILGGDCYTPIAAHATVNDKTLTLNAMVGSLDGTTIITSKTSGAASDATLLGEQVGKELLKKGAAALLNQKD